MANDRGGRATEHLTFLGAVEHPPKLGFHVLWLLTLSHGLQGHGPYGWGELHAGRWVAGTWHGCLCEWELVGPLGNGVLGVCTHGEVPSAPGEGRVSPRGCAP